LNADNVSINWAIRSHEEESTEIMVAVFPHQLQECYIVAFDTVGYIMNDDGKTIETLRPELSL